MYCTCLGCCLRSTVIKKKSTVLLGSTSRIFFSDLFLGSLSRMAISRIYALYMSRIYKFLGSKYCACLRCQFLGCCLGCIVTFSDVNFLENFSDGNFSDEISRKSSFSYEIFSDANTVAFTLRIKNSIHPRGMKVTSEKDEDTLSEMYEDTIR